MSKVKSFIKEVLAQLTGDQDTVIAERNYRTGKATVRGQISSLETDVINQEVAVEQAEEEFLKAKYPTERIENGEAYLNSIYDAKDNLENVRAELEATKASIEYWTKLLVEFDEEVEAPVKA